jgi:tetratricopeptide (TPR) repeat protein
MGMTRTRRLLTRLAPAFLVLLSLPGVTRGDGTNTPPSLNHEALAPELLRAYLQVQAQLQATQLAVERNRQEAEAAAARNAELLETRLRLLEQALVGERARELDSLERSQRLILIFAGVFAGVGLLALLLTAYTQWRSVERVAGVGAAWPALAPRPALGPDVGTLMPLERTETSSTRLLGVIERLEQRIHEHEQAARPVPAASGPAEPKPVTPAPANSSPEERAKAEAKHKVAQIELLLGKGQTLLDLDRAEEALACFDEALALDPRHPEVLVKKGAALEQARKPDEAIACYDRAIATDQSFTMAYLQKGGLFNRLQRYDEALRCYEAALQSQERNGGAG